MTVVHSPRWYRVAALKPRLLPQIKLSRQRVRGETWYLLSDPVLGRSVRLNAAAYAMAARLDGQRTVQQLWERSLQHGQEAATQDEVIDILAQLREAALVQFDRAADFDVLLPHLDKVVRPARRNSVLAWRIPLGNPTAILARMRPLQNVLFSRLALGLWLALTLMLLVLGLQHAPELWAHGRLWMTTPRFAALALALYVPIKLVHELAHGLALRRWGGEVREAGVTLMLLMPVPYVDASAASGFVQRRHRIVVGAAGIMAEITLAALALPLWLWLDAGLLRDGAFVTLFLCGVSTLIFNGNPLQRLDGYYILTDALELPNLGPRSRNWWLDALRRWLLKAPGAEPMAVARGETPWLVLYAPLSWLYMLLVVTLAVAWIGQISLALGVLTGMLLAWQMLVRPAVNLLGQLRRAALAQDATAGRWHRAGWVAAIGALLLLGVPMPHSTLVQGVVWPSEQAQLRAAEGGVVEAVLVPEGQSVQAGEVVLRLTNAQLQASYSRQLARVSALEAARFGSLAGRDLASLDGRAGDAEADLVAAQAALHNLEERLAALQVLAHVDGRVALPRAGDLPGQYVSRGSLIGQVLAEAPLTVRVALPEAQASDLRALQTTASVWLTTTPGLIQGAVLVRDSGGAVLQLPSAALSAKHGGDVQTDPRDSDDLKPMQPVVLLDVQLTELDGSANPRIGERAWVRFESARSPLLWQWAQALKRQVLLRFNPQF